jgi:hypothetical protein
MVKLAREMVCEQTYEDKNYAQLRAEVVKLWHAYLGGQSNGVFWLFGGDANNTVTAPGAPWSTAIISHCEAANYEIKLDNDEWERDYRKREKEFNPLDSDWLGIPGLLEVKADQKVFQIYLWSEQLSYAVRRYDDDLCKRLADVDVCISNIQGACFELFAEKDQFAKAYVASLLASKIYGDKWKREDKNTYHVLMQDHSHHTLKTQLLKKSLKELLVLDRWRLENADNDQTRLTLFLDICGHALDEFNFKRLKKNVIAAQLNVDMEDLEDLWQEKRKEVANKKEKKINYEVTRPATALHGWEAYDLVKDEPTEEVKSDGSKENEAD